MILKRTKDLVLELKRAMGTVDHYSMSRFLLQVYGNTVPWSSSKLTTEETSLSETKYVAAHSNPEKSWVARYRVCSVAQGQQKRRRTSCASGSSILQPRFTSIIEGS